MLSMSLSRKQWSSFFAVFKNMKDRLASLIGNSNKYHVASWTLSSEWFSKTFPSFRIDSLIPTLPSLASFSAWDRSMLKPLLLLLFYCHGDVYCASIHELRIVIWFHCFQQCSIVTVYSYFCGRSFTEYLLCFLRIALM